MNQVSRISDCRMQRCPLRMRNDQMCLPLPNPLHRLNLFCSIGNGFRLKGFDHSSSYLSFFRSLSLIGRVRYVQEGLFGEFVDFWRMLIQTSKHYPFQTSQTRLELCQCLSLPLLRPSNGRTNGARAFGFCYVGVDQQRTAAAAPYT